MLELPVYNKNGDKVDSMKIDETALGGPDIRSALLKQAYVIVHGNQRQGSARSRSRGMVVGSTRKLYRQKGTGNARAGAARTNIRKGGGVTFAKTRDRVDFRRKLSKRMRRLANRNALLAKMKDFEGNLLEEVKVVDEIEFKSPKTSEMASMLKALGVNRTCLVALDAANRDAALSARNIPDVDTIRIDQLNAFDLLNHRFLIVGRESLQAFIDGACSAEQDEKEVA